MIKLSKASKMPCRSWSLQAIDTCPASVGDDGELVDACKGCYATTGNYNFPNVKAPRIHNKEDWQREDWTADMIAELDNDRYFRWFDSGDIFSIEFLNGLIEVCKKTPNTTHWIPTTTWNYPNKEFLSLLQVLQALPNVRLRASNEGSIPTLPKGLYPLQSVVVKEVKAKSTKELFYCPAPKQGGKCRSCKACYNSKISTIAYLEH